MGDLKHYEDDYAKKNFMEEYKEYLKNPNGECPYVDVDTVNSRNVNYYGDLTAFLNKVLNLGFRAPEKGDYPFAIKLWNKDFQETVYFTSDQFGFSVPYGDQSKKSAAWDGNKSYPYAQYLSLKRDDDKGAGDTEKIEFVAECIYETRTIGGSFIWPKVKLGRGYQSIYNCNRGIRGYIDDRVDITLYEIKCFYDFGNKYFCEKGIERNLVNIRAKEHDFILAYRNAEEYSANILINGQSDQERKALYRWLMIFESFEDYVKKLKFESFVIDKDGKYMIRDMVSEAASSPLDIDKVQELRKNKIEKKRKMKDKELKVLLENVRECTKLRSKSIEKVLDTLQ